MNYKSKLELLSDNSDTLRAHEVVDSAIGYALKDGVGCIKAPSNLDERTKAFCKASEGFAFDAEKYMQNMRKLSEATKVSCTEFSNAVNKMNKIKG